MQRDTWRRLVVAFTLALCIGASVAVAGWLVTMRGDLVLSGAVGAVLATFLLTYVALGHWNTE